MQRRWIISTSRKLVNFERAVICMQLIDETNYATCPIERKTRGAVIVNVGNARRNPTAVLYSIAGVRANSSFNKVETPAGSGRGLRYEIKNRSKQAILYWKSARVGWRCIEGYQRGFLHADKNLRVTFDAYASVVSGITSGIHSGLSENLIVLRGSRRTCRIGRQVRSSNEEGRERWMYEIAYARIKTAVDSESRYLRQFLISSRRKFSSLESDGARCLHTVKV